MTTCPDCQHTFDPTQVPGGHCPRCRFMGGAHEAESLQAPLPDCEIVDLIAHGGMGDVYRATQPTLERELAVKVMTGHAATTELAARFRREALVLARLQHPNIVPIHALGTDEDGQPYYTMKLVKGHTLQAILDDLRQGDAETLRQHSLPQLLNAFRKVCDALAFAHAQGVLHRDLKPDNIMIGEFGEVLVMDWGLAKKIKDENEKLKPEAIEQDDPVSSFSFQSSSFTLHGSVLGTPQYMSPEQAAGQVSKLDERSDIYSLGALLYAILTLRPPVEAKTVQEVLEKVKAGTITPLEQGAGLAKSWPAEEQPLVSATPWPVPASLSAVVMKALQRDKTQRYSSVTTLIADIDAYLAGFATGAESAGALKQLKLLMLRHRAVTAALAVLLLLSIGFVLKVMSSERETRRQAGIAQVNEQHAIAEQEKTRHALAKSSLALAEAAYREADGRAMQAALDDVPADLRDSNWSYLLEQSDTSIARVSTGEKMILGVAAHPKLPGVFAVGSSPKSVTLLEARTGKQLLQFDTDFEKSPTGSPFCLAFSPDGERIAWGRSGSRAEGKGKIAIHSTQDGRQLLAWETTSVGKLEFSPDGLRLLQTGDNSPLNLWDAMSGKRLWTYPEGKKDSAAVIMPDGLHLLGCKNSETLVLLGMEDGAESRMTAEIASTCRALAIRPDGLMALWCDEKGYVHGSDLRNGHLIFSSRVHADLVKHLAFTRDGTRFYCAVELPDGRQSIRLFDAKSGEPLQSLTGGSGVVTAMAMHPLSDELLVSGHDSRLWDCSEVSARWVLHAIGNGRGVGGAAFLGSDDLFLGPLNDHNTVLMDLRGPTRLWSPSLVNYHTVTTSSDSRFVAMAGTIDQAAPTRILFGRWEEGKFIEIGEFDASGRGQASLRLSPTGDRLAISAGGASARQRAVLDPATGAQLAALDSETLKAVTHLSWISGGTQLIGLGTAQKPRGLAGSEEWIVVWDAATGRQLNHIVHPTPLDCLTVSPDGSSFATAGADKLVHVFDVKTLAERQAFRAHDGQITALAWHPTKPMVATGSADHTIKLWNLETGRRLDTFRGPSGLIRTLTFSPSGQRLACATMDQTVRIWEPPSLR